MLGSSEYARNMRATQSGVNDQSARRRRQRPDGITPEEAEARWEQAKRDHMIPFHKMALLASPCVEIKLQAHCGLMA